MIKSDFVVAVLLNNFFIILIEAIHYFESLTVISVEYCCKVNPVWFKCFKMIDS